VLVAVDPPGARARLDAALQRLGVARFLRATPGAPQPESILADAIDLVLVSDSFLPTDLAAWVGSMRALPDGPEVVVVDADGDPRRRAAWIAAGCLAAVHAALPERELDALLGALVRRRRDDVARRVVADRAGSRRSLGEFVTLSSSMHEFLETARRVVESDSSLLILGETGVGKERLARSIHHDGRRGPGPFLAVNCGALPEGLLESELFGHERGAFTGASRTRRGYFEQADGGTLFLDEIGELPLHLQVALLRVLEERRVRPLGGERTVPVDVRIIAATNRDLERDVEGKRFRADLYYRLAVVTLTIPPLRERVEDIPRLIDSFVEEMGARLRSPVRSFDADAIRAMQAYPWPGNVRELINVVERTLLLCRRDVVRLADLPRAVSGAAVEGVVAAGAARAGDRPDDDRLEALASRLADRPIREARRELSERFERAYWAELLTRTRGRIGETARLGGITERSLYDRMVRLGLRKEKFRQAGSERARPEKVGRGEG